ncbi:MAG TPA: Gfo/Idh/MocA family oxidoreductase [Acidimicrobiales bacterium]|nr:Gfo/Idh/MocA family oxidoreductase [Acidimicrobiales bacterium]
MRRDGHVVPSNATDRCAHAVIGCGRVAPNHVDGIRHVDGFRVTWACDRDIAQARALASACDIPHVTTDAAEVLDDPEIVSVSIAVDHAQHAPLAAAALRAGKHVLLEKPIALHLEEARALHGLAVDRDVELVVVSQHRYDPVVLTVGEWLVGGIVGDVVLATGHVECGRDTSYYADSYWRGNLQGEGGSVLINQSYHCVDVLRSLCEGFTDAISMMHTFRHTDAMETEDTFAGVLRMSSGGLATISATAAGQTFWDCIITIVGTEGTLAFSLNHPPKLLRWSGSPKLAAAVERFQCAAITEEAAPGIDYYGISHRRQIADFCRAVRGGPRPMVGADDAIETLEVIDRLYRDARSSVADPRAGRPESVPAAAAP